MPTKNNLLMRCEICINCDFSGNNGKNCICKLNNKIIPNINYLPVWCPFYQKLYKLNENDL